MIPDSHNHCPGFTSNGTHTGPGPATSDADDSPRSAAYHSLKSRLEAWEAWELLDTVGKLDVILAHFSARQWLEPDELGVLAAFRHTPPGKWAQIKLTYKEIGGNPHDLQCAVDTLLKTQPQPDMTSSPRWIPITAQALYAKELPPLDFIVEDILPVGATLFVGRAKDGKSLACWNLCLAVATGGVVFGRYAAQHGDVLYLALEDGERRAQKRLQDQMRTMNMTEPPEGFELVLWDAPRVGEGLEEALTTWLDTHPQAKLIVVDILEKVRPPRTRHGSVYADDYHAVAPLQRLAQERNIALIIVHHTHKAKAEDFRDAPSGSMSLLGAADTLWNLKRVAGETEAVLQITGRDLVETSELAMEFKHGFWTAVGDAATTVLNPAHQVIIDTLRTTGYPMTPTQLATVLGANLNTVKVHLLRLVERGLVCKTGQGQYTHRIITPESAETVTPVTCIPVEEEHTTPPPATTQDAGERMTPLMYTLPVTEDMADGDTVTPVTGDDASATTQTPPVSQRPGLPSTNGHTNGHHHGMTPDLLIPCAVCGGITRWNDRGTLRCSRCWPPRS